MSNKGEKKDQIGEALLASGFTIPCQDLMEMFVPDNMRHPEAGPDSAALSKSLTQLQKYRFGPEVTAQLQSSSATGIEASQEDLQKRRRTYGENKRLKRKTRTVCDMIIEVFQDFILKVLIVAAIVSTTLGIIKDGWAHGFQEGAGIVIAIIIIVLVTVVNDYAKEKKFQELMAQGDVAMADVMRGGVRTEIDTEELVVGDIIYVKTGDTIPADALVLEQAGCSCSEAALTGEPDGLPKETVDLDNLNSHPDPFMLQGSLCEKGSATAIVLAVGNNTMQGRAGLAMNIADEQTPLQKKLDRIANGIGKLGVAVAILTLIAICITSTIKVFQNDDKAFDMNYVTDLCNGLVIAITVVVVAVPEGLPLAVTISLAFSVKQMQKEHNLVRKLHSSETMGNANEICTDKTGTLTQNKMSVQSAYLEDRIVDGETADILNMGSAEAIQSAVIFNCTAYVDMAKEDKPLTGNVTEVGLLGYLRKSGCPVADQCTERNAQKPIFDIPFSSVRKRQTTARWINNGQTVRCFVKGAPEMVIKFCTNFFDSSASVAPLDDEKKDYAINTVVKGYAKKTLRCLLVAYVDFSKDEWEQMNADNAGFETEESRAIVENNLTMVGIFGLKDPLRPKIKESVETCHAAGINVRMVTGDNIDTAKAISLEAGIITEEDLAKDDEDSKYLCMEGGDFQAAIGAKLETVFKEKEVDSDASEPEDEEGEKKKVKVVECTMQNVRVFRKIADRLRVMARSQPDHKFMLVDGLIKEGRTVAVTGDGTNDAPALNRSDVGFAMGITGTDVAKNACDITLMDDDFCSILTAVRFGRSIYDNVRKFLQFQLTVNVVAMFIVFAGACLFSEPPLTSTQMLWVNLIMDTFAALALATEPPSKNVLERKPADKSDAIVNQIMWRNIVGQSIFQIIVLLILMFKGGDIFNIDYKQSDPFYPTAEQVADHPLEGWIEQEPTTKVLMYSIIFQTFVFMQLFNQINSRKLGEREFNIFADFFNNWLFIVITIATFGIQVLIVQKGDRYMRCVPLTWQQNLWCAGIGAFSIIWGFFLKFVPAAWFAWIKLEDTPMKKQEEQSSMVASLRKSHTMRSGSQRSSIRRGQTSKRIEDDEGFKAIN